MKRAIGIAVAALSWLVSVPGLAQDEEPVAWLHVSRTELAAECPGPREIAVRVNEIAGRRALVEQDVAGLGLSVRFDRSPQGFTAEISLYGRRSGRRRLIDPGDTCADLTDALAVTLALLLDEGAVEPQVSPMVSPEPPREEPPKEQPPERAPEPFFEPEFRRRPTPPEPPPTWTVDLGAMQTGGILSSAAPAGVIGTDFVFADPFSVGAGMLWMPSDKLEFAGGQVQLSLVAWLVQGCVTFLRGQTPIAVSVCVFPAAGVLTGDGTGYATDRQASQSWLAGGASVVADGQIVGPLGFSARLAGVVPLSRDFIVETEGGGEAAEASGVAFETSPAGVLAGLSVRATIF